MCQAEGKPYSLASVVDHITPHRGDYALFWDQANWQSLCAPHHNGAKQSIDKGRGSPKKDGDPQRPAPKFARNNSAKSVFEYSI